MKLDDEALDLYRRRRLMGEAERFWSYVEKGDGCWEWKGGHASYGYGQTYFRGRGEKAHRAAWALTNGPIPLGMFVCHHCDNRNCVRPDHLFLGTNADNLADAAKKLRFATEARLRRAKLTPDGVREMRRLASSGMTVTELAAKYGVSDTVVGKVIRHRAWRHIQ